MLKGAHAVFKVFPLKRKGVLIVPLLIATLLLPAISCNLTFWANNSSQIPSDIETWIANLHTMRQNSYYAVNQIRGLLDLPLPPPGSLDLPTNYNAFVESSFNTWIGQLITEVNSGQNTINTSEDTQQETTAIAFNNGFIQWAQQIFNTFGQRGRISAPGTHQGGYLTAMRPMGDEPPALEDFINEFLTQLKEKAQDDLGDLGEFVVTQSYQTALADQLKDAEWADWSNVPQSAG